MRNEVVIAIVDCLKILLAPLGKQPCKDIVEPFSVVNAFSTPKIRTLYSIEMFHTLYFATSLPSI